MKVKRNFEEMFKRVCEEFRMHSYEEVNMSDDCKAFESNRGTVYVTKRGDCVQVFSNFSHDWSAWVFPCRCIMTVLGNSLFYYGEIIYDE